MPHSADSGRAIRPDDGFGHYEDCGSQCPCYKAGYLAALEKYNSIAQVLIPPHNPQVRDRP